MDASAPKDASALMDADGGTDAADAPGAGVPPVSPAVAALAALRSETAPESNGASAATADDKSPDEEGARLEDARQEAATPGRIAGRPGNGRPNKRGGRACAQADTPSTDSSAAPSLVDPASNGDAGDPAVSDPDGQMSSQLQPPADRPARA
jgi:hypothetical protein